MYNWNDIKEFGAIVLATIIFLSIYGIAVVLGIFENAKQWLIK